MRQSLRRRMTHSGQWLLDVIRLRILKAQSFSRSFLGGYDFNLTLLEALTMVRGLNPKNLESTMRGFPAIMLTALALIVFSAGVAEAGKRKCAEDYRRFCSQWGLGTRGLENCMRRHGDQLTKACVRGLIAAGAVSQAEVDRRRRAAGR